MLKKIGISTAALFTALAFLPASAMAHDRDDFRYGRGDGDRFRNEREAREYRERMERIRRDEYRTREFREHRFEGYGR
jgi:hypothetical protein